MIQKNLKNKIHLIQIRILEINFHFFKIIVKTLIFFYLNADLKLDIIPKKIEMQKDKENYVKILSFHLSNLKNHLKHIRKAVIESFLRNAIKKDINFLIQEICKYIKKVALNIIKIAL